MTQSISKLTRYIYGDEEGAELEKQIHAQILKAQKDIQAPSHRGKGELPLDNGDSILITYGDNFIEEGKPPLANLRDFADAKLRDIFSSIHILPFFPYSSDDGFSIIDYYKVNPSLGTWREIQEIGSVFKLMSDLVLNHCSAKNDWFLKFLHDDPHYRNYFISVDKDTDVSMIVRPRTHPLLTLFETDRGTEYVWTTFSADQVDLNFSNSDVLLEMLKVLLFHIKNGIQIIRLDAIAYLWKELGHPSIHHEKTHAVVKLFRAILNVAAPWVVIITETNVPHAENISYFGNMDDEAHMVYQFSLPPLVLDAFRREDTRHIQKWASELPDTLGKTTFFNFLASHDGIGLLPAKGILSEEEINGLVETTKERGGFINYKSTPEGEIPYEMNITYLGAIAEKELPVSVRARKFLASQALMLTLRGVPGIYVHSLLGSENYPAGVKQTGQNRSINREKLSYSEVMQELNTPGTLRNRIFSGFQDMLKIRRQEPSFHPAGRMQVMPTQPNVLCILRISPDNSECVLTFINVNPGLTTAELPIGLLPRPLKTNYTELIRGDLFAATLKRDTVEYQLEGFGVYWLK